MSKLKILNCESDGIAQRARAILESVGDVTFKELSREALLDEISAYDGLVLRLGHRVDAEVLGRAPRLKFVATPTTGIDHIDVGEAEKRGVAVLSLKGDVEFLRGVTATAEHAFGLLLALMRKTPSASADVLCGRWRREDFQGRELNGMTLGIVGLGRLGRMMAGYAKAFGMTPIAHDPYVADAEFKSCGARRVDLEALLKTADAITLHVGLSEETRGFFGAREFASMKKGAFFINTSRGEVVDETGLLASLSDRHLGGAALDVLAGENAGRSLGNETWLERHPLLAYARDHDNLLITPHVGGMTIESLAKAEVRLAGLIADFLRSNTPQCG